MIALIQRVMHASVTVESERLAQIDRGMLVFPGVEKLGNRGRANKMVQKLLNYRIFADSEGKMNLSVLVINGQVLMVPQFTLVADTDKGMRPSLFHVASPEKGLELFTQVVDIMQQQGKRVNSQLSPNCLQSGKFGADMSVELVNDGPVTFYLQA